MDVKNQVKEILDQSKTKVSEGMKQLEGLYMKALAPIKEKSITELLEQFGSLKPGEVVDRIKNSELGKHWQVIVNEVLTTFGIAKTEDLKELQTQLEALQAELEALKKVKTDLTALKREFTKFKKATAKS